MTNQNEIDRQVESLNDFLKKKPWFDFDVVACSPYQVLLHEGLDLAVSPEIEIKFSEIFFVSLLMSWRTDTAVRALFIVEGESELLINTKYQIEEGFYLFRFQPEDYSDEVGCLIVAKTIAWRVLVPPENLGR